MQAASSPLFRPPRSAHFGFSILLAVAILLSGLAIQAGTTVAIGYVALVIAPVVLTLSTRSSITLLVVFAFVISGLLFFFARITLANWIPYLLSAALGVRLILNRIAASGSRHAENNLHGAPPFSIGILLFLSLVALSAVINDTPIGFDVLALKHFGLLWIPMLLIWKNRKFESSWLFLWKLFIAIAILQFPFALVQRLHSFGTRTVGLNWDSVVGTFGGDPDGGGASGAMGLFLVFSVLLAGSLWRAGIVRGRLFVLVTFCAVTVIGLAEVKAALLLLPVAFLYLFRDQVAKRPGTFAIASSTGGVVFFAMLYAYYLMYVGKEGVDSGFVETLLPKFTNFFDPYFVDRVTGEVGRIPALFLWWNFNSGEPYSVWFGHGPMAVRVSSVFGVGDVLRTSRLNLGMFSLPVFLWEFGAFASMTYVLSLVSALRTAYRLSRHSAFPPEHRAALSASAFGVFMILIFMPYNRDLIDVPSIPLLLALLLGHCGYWWRRARSLQKNAATTLALSTP